MRRQWRCITACFLSILSLTSGLGYTAEISIIAVGDITIGSRLTPIIERHGIDSLFAGTTDLIKSADVGLTTLNTSISDRGEPQRGVSHPFRASPALARGIANAGFEVVSLATPHIMDFGAKGLVDTIRLLNWYQVKTAGAGQTPEVRDAPAWLNVKTAKIAFLAYSHGDAFGTEPADMIAHTAYSKMTQAVESAKQDADLVVVSIHWGKKRNTQTVSKRQRFFAHGLIDAGADLVLCQRLQTWQGIEIYKGKPVIYSLGDFIYDTYDKQYSKVVIPKITFDSRVLKSIELTPIWVDNPEVKYQPQILSGDDAREALVNYQRLCSEFNTTVSIKNDRGWIEPKIAEKVKVPIDPQELF
ncbi:MAG: CapA family protein [Candidatus Poribacteria bacterium]|nr:CapA family protein [Candidatus Poribacteria bacterium]